VDPPYHMCLGLLLVGDTVQGGPSPMLHFHRMGVYAEVHTQEQRGKEEISSLGKFPLSRSGSDDY